MLKKYVCRTCFSIYLGVNCECVLLFFTQWETLTIAFNLTLYLKDNRAILRNQHFILVDGQSYILVKYPVGDIADHVII